MNLQTLQIINSIEKIKITKIFAKNRENPPPLYVGDNSIPHSFLVTEENHLCCSLCSGCHKGPEVRIRGPD